MDERVIRALILAISIPIILHGGCPAPSAQEVPPKATDGPLHLVAVKLALQSGDLSDGIRQALVAVEARPNDPEASVLLAGAYELGGHHEKAVAEADRALGIDNGSVGARVTKSAALIGLKQYDEAIRVAHEALDRDSNNQAALLNLACAHEALDAWSEQAEALKALLALEPDDVDARMMLARNQMRIGAFETAVQEALEAEKRLPRETKIHVFLAAAYYEWGRMHDAMDQANIALRLEPDHSDAHEVFRAAFYVAVAGDMSCLYGTSPWTKSDVDRVLATYERQGISGVQSYFQLATVFGSRADVQERVKRQSQECPKNSAVLPSVP
jgi:tetratricopeptide (TPR) repeat protein